MLEIALHFEQTATQLRPIILISAGLACVIIGLFLWLGGLGFRKVLVAVAGAVGGSICGLFIVGRNIISAMILAAVAGFIAIIFERIFITILAAALAAVLGFAVLAGSYIEKQQGTVPINQGKAQNLTEPLTLRQSIETVKAYTADFSNEIKQTCSQMPVYNWAIIAALVVIFIAAGFFLWRLTSALCCAALGTMLVFAGMVLLLLYKGAGPISCISRRQLFYAAVFLVMTAFGTIEQLLLCQRTKKQSTTKKEIKNNEERPNKTTLDWRSH